MHRSARTAVLTSNSTSTKSKQKNAVINYITKHPSNSKAWQKLIQICKYFYAKNPILVIEDLWWDDEEERWFSLNNGEGPVDVTNISLKLWITNKFNAVCTSSKNISLIIPKIYKCDANSFRLLNDVISYEDFSFLSSNLEKIIFHNSIVKNSDGSIVPFEKFIAVLPKIKSIFFYDKIDSSCITKNTVKEFLQISHFSKIDRFELFNTTEKFDIETFLTYLKKNKHTKFIIIFNNSIPQVYKNRVEAIIDKIIETEEHDYKIPYIKFDGINIEKWKKFQSIY